VHARGTDELGAALQELGGEDDGRGGAVADLLVLELGEVDEDLRCFLWGVDELAAKKRGK